MTRQPTSEQIDSVVKITGEIGAAPEWDNLCRSLHSAKSIEMVCANLMMLGITESVEVSLLMAVCFGYYLACTIHEIEQLEELTK